MLREWAFVATLFACAPGCSLILNFSDNQIPKDAAIDGPFTLDECQYKEPNDTAATAAPITPGVDTGPAAICPTTPGVDDVDYYSFAVPTGTNKTTVAIQFTNRPGGDLDLILYDSTPSMIAQSRGFGDGETIVCPAASPPCAALSPGNYIFEVVPGTAGDVNNYTFSVAFE